MSKRRIRSESIENLRRVVENDHVDVEGKMDVVMADAYSENIVNSDHAEDVKDELDKKAEPIITDNPTTGKEVKNNFTAKLVLDESIDDFAMKSDGRANKVYEDDDEDDYLDYDMFDFIYGLVTDCWPKPINPLGHRIRKFMYIGSDDYLKTNDPNNRSQVATTGNSIEVYANTEKDFDDIKAICDLYGFKYDGPNPKRSKLSHWEFTFKIYVPLAASGYPEMVEDYFENIGKTLEDVMPADFCKQYRKRQAKIEVEANKLLNEKEVERITNHAIMMAARDSDPLELHLKKLFSTLDDSGLTYQKTKIKKMFMDAFDDENMDESLNEDSLDDCNIHGKDYYISKIADLYNTCSNYYEEPNADLLDYIFDNVNDINKKYNTKGIAFSGLYEDAVPLSVIVDLWKNIQKFDIVMN